VSGSANFYGQRTRLYQFQGSLLAGQKLSVADGLAQAPAFKIAGQGRVYATFCSTQAAAVGFPLVQLSTIAAGTTEDIIVPITNDATQLPNYVYSIEFDVPALSFMIVEFQNSAVAGATFECEIWVYPEPSGSNYSGGGGGTPSSPTFVKDAPLTPLGFGASNVVTSGAAVSLATIYGAAIPVGAIYAQITLGTGQSGDTSVTCNWRDDGTAPTAAAGGGVPLFLDQQIFYEGNLSQFQIIGTTVADSTVCVAFYK
jgi:hypothetical protein